MPLARPYQPSRAPCRSPQAAAPRFQFLVCAYADESKWNGARLEGAIPLAGFEARAATLPKSQELIFYCG
jgi:hypothetical protein